MKKLKRKRSSSCTSESTVGACIAKKPYYDSIPKRFDDLTDDLLFEIFLKLPARILHRCKSVSKRWLSLISSSSFARSFIRLSNNVPATRMLLFKLASKSLWIVGHIYAIPLLHDDHVVDFSSLPPSSFDFIPPLKEWEVKDRSLGSIHLVGTSGGLVLLKGQFMNPSFSRKIPKNHCNYYICNPITKHWLELPLIRTSDHVGFTCYYLQDESRNSRIWADVASVAASYDNYDPNKIEFTVVDIKTNNRARVFVIHVLSSADKVSRWNKRRVPFPPGWTSSVLYRLYGGVAVFAHGKFHWLGENCIAAYDPFCNPLQCDLIPLDI